MNEPLVADPQTIDADTTALATWLPIPGLGVLTVQSFVIRSAEPVLVDTGVNGFEDAFLANLARVIDPAALRWIWLTHTDADHTGALERLMTLAPNARVVTTFLGLAKLGLQGKAVPPERIFLLNPGQRLDVGDRQLLAFRPPVFDAPETTGLFDARAGNLISSDSFGGLLAEPVETAEDVPEHALREGIATWTTVDSPWLHGSSESALLRNLDAVRAFAPRRLLSSHLPVATRIEPLLAGVAAARTATPFVGPDQAAFMASMAGAA